MLPTFDQFLLLEERRNNIVYEMALSGKKLKKAISDLMDSKQNLDNMQKNMQACLATRDFLFYEAKVVLLSEWDRATRIINSNKTLIPETKEQIKFFETTVKALNKHISDMSKELKEVERKMSTFGKVINFNANR